jgi:membrane-bound lytic murein transglycosylase D
MPIYRGLILATTALVLFGCAPRPSPQVPIELGDPPPAGDSLASLPRATASGDFAVAPLPAEAPQEEPRHAEIPCPPAEGAEPTNFDLDHAGVEPYLNRYLESGRRSLEKALNRSQAFVPRFQKTMEAEGVPPELAYLPLVESHFENTARSHAGAVGLWQFMPATAQRYGLRVDRCIDERRDPQLSTRAAARYLGDLYERFDDWHLALAAYNAGEGTVLRALRDNDVDDYWAMVARGLLPAETCSFVPKFLAAVTVAERAPDLGIEISPDAGRTWRHATFNVDRPLPLTTVAKLAGTDLARIRELNPALRCDRVPRGGYTIRIPPERLDRFKIAYAHLESRDKIVVASAGRRGTHRVRRGESPASIARRYGVSVGALMKVNGIRNPRQLRVNSRLTIPTEPI